MKEVHGEIKGEKCPFCQKTFSRKAHLRDHEKAVHKDKYVGEQPDFECQICDKKYKQKRNLERHTREVHEDKKLECPKCPNPSILVGPTAPLIRHSLQS